MPWATGPGGRSSSAWPITRRRSASGRRLPVTRPAVSQHLKVLKDAGLVFAERAGTRRIYRIDPTGADALRAYLDRFWGDALRSFQTVVEAHPETLQEQP